MKILNIGSLNIDNVYQVNHFVRAGETLPSFRLDHFAGGKGLNQSIACARAGAAIYHAGFVGKDGAFLVQYLREAGVNVQQVKVLPDVSTGHAIIQVDQKGQNCILLYSGANTCLTEEYVDAVIDHFEPGDILLLQNETSCVEYAIKRGAFRGLQVALNLSPVSKELTASPVLKKVKWFLINEVEGQAMSGESRPEKICRCLTGQFPQSNIVLTLGEDGVMLASKGRPPLYHKAFSVHVVDTTAAGDTFAGYFLASVAKGLPEEACLEYATRASAIAINRPGASPSIPTWEETEHFQICG